jgi:hypothetical protein
MNNPRGRPGPPKTHHVTIDYDGTTLSAEPEDLVGVFPRDTVEWSCADHPWAIQFVGEGRPGSSERRFPPLDRQSARGGPGEAGSVRVQPGARLGEQWEYVVTVWDADKGEVITLDPDIVIGHR